VLFDIDAPPGFQYRNDFITIAEEADLAGEIARIEFATFEMRGVVAKRRVAFFGRSYDQGAHATPPIPAFLFPLRAKLADWLGVEPAAFAMALINEYTVGAPVGWHRDAPQYDIVAGVSLLSACRMTFRPYVAPRATAGRERKTGEAKRRTATHEITLERRSAYLMTRDARTRYEHHVPPVTSLRYSITFRTLRPGM
jgi:alkylated DNA repair dioxygenase AlkB